MLAVQPRGPLAVFFSRPKFTWIVPDQIVAMALPSNRDLARMRRMGITLLVSVVSTPLSQEDLHKARVKYLHLPVQYLRAPSPEQIQAFIDATKAEVAAGGKVAVHCVGGIGRTGTVIACYLVDQGMTAQEALAFIRAKRSGSIESLEQENAVYMWAARRTVHVTTDEPLIEAAVEPEPPAAETADTYVMAEPEATRALSDEERVAAMTRVAQTGYLRWHPDGAGVDIRALFSGDGEWPKIETLKAALRNLNTDNGIMVTLTETLGRNGEAWITVGCGAGEQGALLTTTGAIVDMLVEAKVYEEVLLSSE
jgi:atypical dual specificity phosphatase